ACASPMGIARMFVLKAPFRRFDPVSRALQVGNRILPRFRPGAFPARCLRPPLWEDGCLGLLHDRYLATPIFQADRVNDGHSTQVRELSHCSHGGVESSRPSLVVAYALSERPTEWVQNPRNATLLRLGSWRLQT